jgi:hypothetical protein
MVHHLRVMPQHLVVEVAPDQLRQPDLGAARAGRHALVGLAREPADRHRAEAQVGAQVARPLDRGKVARVGIAVDARQEVIQQAPARRSCRLGRRSSCRLVGSKPMSASVGHAVCAGGLRRQVPGVCFSTGYARRKNVVDLLQPGVLVGREHAVGLAVWREHLAALEDHVVLEGVQHDAGIGQQRRACAAVARQRSRARRHGWRRPPATSSWRRQVATRPGDEPWRTSRPTPAPPAAAPWCTQLGRPARPGCRG